MESTAAHRECGKAKRSTRKRTAECHLRSDLIYVELVFESTARAVFPEDDGTERRTVLGGAVALPERV